MTRALLLRPSLCLVVLVALLLPGAYASAAGGGVPLTVTFPTTGTFLGADLVSPTYADGEDCSAIGICLRVQLISNTKTLALDTRGTAGPRTLAINFTDFCGKVAGDCGVLLGLDPTDPNSGFPFNSSTTGFDTSTNTLSTEALLEVLLSKPFPSSGNTEGTVKLWFTTADGRNWRVHWNFVQVKVVEVEVGGVFVFDHWDIVADGRKDSEVAGLSELSGKRTKPGDIGNKGFYKIPFVLHACEGVFPSCP